MIDERTSQSIAYWSNSLGIDPNLIQAVINTESGGNPNALGSSGEVGLMQLMPTTAAYYGISRDQLFDPYYNIQAGASYLNDMVNKYGLEGGIQAYNLGETKFNKGLTSPTYLAKVMKNYTFTETIPNEETPVEASIAEELGILEAGFTGSNVTMLIMVGLGIGLLFELRRKKK